MAGRSKQTSPGRVLSWNWQSRPRGFKLPDDGPMPGSINCLKPMVNPSEYGVGLRVCFAGVPVLDPTWKYIILGQGRRGDGGSDTLGQLMNCSF